MKNDKRVFLHFGRLSFFEWKRNRSAHRWIYPFNFEVTNALKNGENSLVVKVDNKRKLEAVPTINTDWWNYGGITREVTLIETPATFVRDYYVQLKKSDKNLIQGWIQLDGKQLAKSLKLEIPELKIVQQLTPDGYAAFEIKAKPLLWSPENPKLYKVNITVDNETLTDDIGFRTIETKGAQILLNGKPVFLRGICIHEETAFSSNRAYSKEQDITLLQWAGIWVAILFMPMAHYPHNEQMVRQAEGWV